MFKLLANFYCALILIACPSFLMAQCISDDCGDIIAKFVLAGQETVVCEGTEFEVINLTEEPDIDYYIWDWGDGTRDTVFTTANQTHTYYGLDDEACAQSSDVFDIILEIRRSCGTDYSCHFTRTGVLVKYRPRVEFVPTNVCAGEQVGFGPLICNADSVHWDFGNGDTSSELDPDYSFSDPGQYWVTVEAYNDCGVDIDSGLVIVTGQPLAAAAPAGGASSGCVPHVVTFENNSQYTDTYAWSISPDTGFVFLDSTDRFSPEPRLEFFQTGTYTISLEASNECGADEWTGTFTVYDTAVPTLDSLPAGCGSLTVSPTASFTFANRIESVEWTFTNGSPTTATGPIPPEVTFAQSGSIAVAVTSTCGVAYDTLAVTVDELTTIDLVLPDGPLCVTSDAIQLSAGPPGGNWSGPAVTSDGRFYPDSAGIGTFTLEYRLGDACASRASGTVEVVAAEPVTTESAVDFCETDGAYTIGFTPTGGTWSGPGIVDEQAGVFDPGVAGPGEHILIYAYADQVGCVVQKNTAATVAPLPVLDLPDLGLACLSDDPVALAQELGIAPDPPGGSTVWSGPGIIDPAAGTWSANQNGADGVGEYPVSLTYSLAQCSVTDSLVLSVGPVVPAEAGPDQRVCADLGAYQLTATPEGGVWSGPGVDAATGRIDFADLGEGPHRYRYEYGIGTSCYTVDSVQVELVDFSGNAVAPEVRICAGEAAFELPMPSLPGGVWSGPGIVDPAAGTFDPAAVGAGDFMAVYTLSDAQAGCADSVFTTVIVDPLPVVEFAAPAELCVGAPVDFSGTFSAGCTFEWDFGDGMSSAAENPAHAYTEPGEYTVSLTVRSCADCVASYSRTVRVVAAPEARFDPSTAAGCGALDVQFINQSSGYALSYAWDFGNGTGANEAVPPPVTYPTPVNDTLYQIRLTVRNFCGEAIHTDSVRVRARPTARFGTPSDDGCSPLTVTFANTTQGNAEQFFWEFGNGVTSTDSLPPPQTFYTIDDALTTYDVRLIARNSCGADTVVRQVAVHPDQVQSFIAIDTSYGCLPLTVEFENYSTPGATVTWDFGDGAHSAQADVSHTYDSAGVYTVYQYVDNGCEADTGAVEITVLPAPAVGFRHPPLACLGQEVQFENTSEGITTSAWDFGDGGTSPFRDPRYAFDSVGTFAVSLTAYSAAYNCPATYTSSIEVLPQPTAGLTADTLRGCPPLRVCFANESENAEFFDWSFGDGNGSVAEEPCHVFTEPGVHSVRLLSSDANGCYSDSAMVNIRVYDKPTAGIGELEPMSCGLPDRVAYPNASEGAVAYAWDLGNGTTSTLTNPATTYTAPGTYEISLVATNTFGCTDTVYTSRDVNPQPVIDFDPTGVEGCAPVTVTFGNYTTGANQYTWTFGNGETTTEAAPQVVFTRPGTYYTKLVASFDGQCADSLVLTDAVVILPSPKAEFIWREVESGPAGLVEFINFSTDASAYLWSFGDGSTSNEENVQYEYEDNGPWEVILEATNANGCQDTARAEVGPEIFYGLHFPNALSPETGLGDVQVFKPAGIGLRNWELQIYSPWGELVYRSEKVEGERPAAAWDGRHYRTGKMLPQGAYAYQAAVEYVNGLRKYYKGSVTLLR